MAKKRIFRGILTLKPKKINFNFIIEKKVCLIKKLYFYIKITHFGEFGPIKIIFRGVFGPKTYKGQNFNFVLEKICLIKNYIFT